MKAGIYQTPNKNLIYVAKDRTIKATTVTPSSWVGTKVSEKKGQVVIEGTTYHCDRVGDVPNGCTDPMQLLVDKMEELKAQDPSDWDAVLSASGNTDKQSETVADPSQWKSGGPWPSNFYSGDLGPRDGDVLIEFEDKGQDFLRWTLRQNDDGYMAVIDSLPYEKYLWEGMLVHNADNLLKGVTDKIHVSRPTHDNGFGSFDISVKVINVSKVVDRQAINKALFSPYGIEKHIAQKISAEQALQEIIDNLEKQGYVNTPGTDEWVSPDVQTKTFKASRIYKEMPDGSLQHLGPAEPVMLLRTNHEMLCAALGSYGFVYNPETKEFEASEEDFRKFSKAREHGHVQELDDLGPYVIGIARPASPSPETEEQRKEREEKNWSRLHATLDRVRQTCGGAPVSPPPMNAIDAAYSAEDTALAALKAGQFRLCHAAAARKHKKKRDRHVWFHPIFGCYAWRMIA